MEGTVQGPFDVEMYGFGFENPPVDFPFLSGYYDFDYIEGQYIKSRNLDFDLSFVTVGKTEIKYNYDINFLRNYLGVDYKNVGKSVYRLFHNSSLDMHHHHPEIHQHRLA